MALTFSLSWLLQDARVSAHNVSVDSSGKTVYLIKFSDAVMERERRMGAA